MFTVLQYLENTSYFNAETVLTAKNCCFKIGETPLPVIKPNTFFSKHALNALKQTGHQNSRSTPRVIDVQIHHGTK